MTTETETDITLGTRVEKVSGYAFPGQVVSAFHTKAGKLRFVVECTNHECAGMLHIFRPEQLKRRLYK